MIIGRTVLVLAAAALTLGACVGPRIGSAPSRMETIAWSTGPCFGFCPVYKVAVTPTGTISFDGERHTAMLGKQERVGGAAAYWTVASALAGYRPATGSTAQTTCEQQASDQSTTRITWTAPDGTITTLEHDKGCRSPRNAALNETLQALPGQIGIGEWTKQVTRPGASRG